MIDAALRQIGLTERHAKTRRVLRWLQANGRDQVSREDVRREALARHLDAEETQKVIDALERAGWLKKVTTETAGRAKHRWSLAWPGVSVNVDQTTTVSLALSTDRSDNEYRNIPVRGRTFDEVLGVTTGEQGDPNGEPGEPTGGSM